jgi:hypothetical protein
MPTPLPSLKPAPVPTLCYGPVLDRNGRQLTPTVDIALDALWTLTGAQTDRLA